MLSPLNFKQNEAWVAFKMTMRPIQTQTDGNFDGFAIVEVATGIVLCHHFVPVAISDPPTLIAEQMLDEAHGMQGTFPDTLFLSDRHAWTELRAEADRRNVAVVTVPEAHLLEIIDPPRKGLNAYLFGE